MGGYGEGWIEGNIVNSINDMGGYGEGWIEGNIGWLVHDMNHEGRKYWMISSW
jgi:hypothetical protein